MMIVFLLSSFFARHYFAAELESGAMTLAGARKFSGLWLGALLSMVLVLVSNNLGIMWVGVEASTLMTAFLICTHVTPASLEAMWKYLLMCSVGVACAFMGTLLVAAAAQPLHLPEGEQLLWTGLMAGIAQADLPLLQLGFLFLLVGYGTKAGLAPLHNWLPDAHSQAPAPVSALFSGFLLNAALYCIMRYIPILEKATGGSGWALKILVVFGLMSIVVAAAFIVVQKDLKRLLAYSSIEHIGIITLGLGLGGIGAFAALFHMFNHSLCKTLAFLSAGQIGRRYGTYRIADIRGTRRAIPLWGLCLLTVLLALIGVAPFAIFVSEFLLVKAALDARAYAALSLFLGGSVVIFVGVLRQAMSMTWGDPPPAAARSPHRPGFLEMAAVLLALGGVLVTGICLPGFFRNIIEHAARIVSPWP
jgi:hydrogenase-4 component F